MSQLPPQRLADIVAAGGLPYIAALIEHGYTTGQVEQFLRAQFPRAATSSINAALNYGYEAYGRSAELGGWQSGWVMPAGQNPVVVTGATQWQYTAYVSFVSPTTGQLDVRTFTVTSPTSLSQAQLGAEIETMFAVGEFETEGAQSPKGIPTGATIASINLFSVARAF